MDSKRGDELQGETEVPYVANVKPVIVPPRIGSNSVNLGGDLEVEIKMTTEVDVETRLRTKRKKPRRFGGNQK